MTSSLEYLLGNYFHQDLYEVHGGEWAALDAFIRDDPHRASEVAQQIDAVLASNDAELAEYVERTGCEYVPTGGYRAWLAEIAQRVRTATGRT